jgi:nucleoside-diphosphate-sugar epimerase
MKILVTGGTGFLGRRAVAALSGRHEIRLLVRPGVRSQASRSGFPAGVSLASGDVTDRASLAAAMAGCDAILHAAALVKILAPKEQFDRVNVGGLANALAAAQEAGVARFLYVSSFIALGPTEGGPGGVLDEDAEPIPSDGERAWINDYERTKALGDRRARQAIAAGAPVAVVYPGVIYGPGEMTEGNLVVRHLLDLVHRRLPALLGRPERRWCYVHVDDVADGIRRTIEAPSFGGRYVLGGENVTLGEFYALVERLTQVKVPTRRLPDGLAKLLGALQKSFARMTGGTPALTPDLVEVYRHDWAYSSARAQEDLGYAPRALAQGLAETVAWLRESGTWAT